MRLRPAAGALFCLALASTGGAQLSGPMSSSLPASATTATPAATAPTPAGSAPAADDVQTLFASTCGWCHSGGGRLPGKGPQLMGTTLTDEQIVFRIKTGKPGAMPAFANAFNDQQLKAIVKYIRDLKPDGSTK
jgi:mono/diheme cytochrome c family protein